MCIDVCSLAQRPGANFYGVFVSFKLLLFIMAAFITTLCRHKNIIYGMYGAFIALPRIDDFYGSQNENFASLLSLVLERKKLLKCEDV